MKRLVISSNGLNRYGYRVISSGGRFESYKKNPVLLLGHNTWGMPVGRVEDLKTHSDGTISCVPVFDEEDELGAAAKHKWKNGFLFAASIGFRPLKFSSDEKDLLPGQKRETVLEWELMEISLVSVPGNVDAAAGMSLSAYSDADIPPISQTTVLKMDKIALALGLNSEADEAAILAAIGKLQGDMKTLGAERVNALLEAGKAKGVVTDENLESWRTLAAASYEQAAAIINGAAQPVEAVLEETTPDDQAKPGQGATLMGQLNAGAPKPNAQNKKAEGREDWTFDDWSKKDSKGLAAMRKDDPERYAQLAAAKYESV